ncbi:unnamed protein product [Cylindrotheca closterium]|uniref:Orc1-like AAA ATPase domain-containing protein n=1 Tax=Cylindrotheca closterium TaxID=2856 RepID=A0AAD2JMW0_9STRA|nr:unnamed protein product [Cylindrotheca closterium]
MDQHVGNGRTSASLKHGDEFTASTSGGATKNSVKGELSGEFEPSKPIGPAGRKESYHLQELTINKLKFDSLGLIGRKRERDCLKRCYRRMMGHEEGSSSKSSDENDSKVQGNNDKTKGRRELIFIQGPSGVGKTTIANTLKRDIAKEESGLFVNGKFDLSHSEEPYSGIAQALGQICVAIKKQEVMRKRKNPLGEDEPSTGAITEKADFATELISALGSEVHLLVKLVPQLEMIVPDLSEESPEPFFDADAGRNRWAFAFRVLMRAMTSCFAPIVILLDDLQWADASSLELIESLISDEENSNALMIVGCFRPEEVGEDNYLAETERRLEKKVAAVQYSFTVTSLELDNLNVDETHEMIMELLNDDDEDHSRGLAVICHERTMGNPYFLIALLGMLEEEGLLEFQFALLQWIWNEDDISYKTMSTTSIVDLLQRQMKKLPQNVQLMLQYAACLGSSIRVSTLEVLWDTHAVAVLGERSEDLSRLFGELEDAAHFIEYFGVKSFRFVHDEVREAALSLAAEDTVSFQFAVGSSLFHDFGVDGLDELLFEVANLMNKGSLETSVELANLNLKAAEQANKMAAFSSALMYVSKGIDLLPVDRWTNNYDMTLRLCTLGAELAFALRQKTTVEKFCKEVLSQAFCTEMEKFPINLTKCLTLYTMDENTNESIDLCLDVLAELGSPRWNMAVISMGSSVPLLKAIETAKTLEKEEYQALPKMEDPQLLSIVHLLVRLTYIARVSEKPVIVDLCTTQIVRMTLKYGVSAESGVGFANLGLLAASVFGDYEVACFFAEVSGLLQSIVPSKYSESDVLATSCQLALPHTKSFSDCLSPALRGYQLGMQAGNLNGAMWCLMTHSLMYPYQMGKPLLGILENCSKTLHQIQDLRQKDQHLITRMFWQMVLNLTGKSKGKTNLRGAAFNEEKKQTVTALERAYLDAFRLQLMIFFGEYKEAGTLVIDTGGFSTIAPKYFFGMVDTFFRGFAMYLLAHRTRKRKHLQLANEIQTTIEKWAQNGNPNVQHYHLFLCAEQAAYDKKSTEAASLFRKAIVLATRTGHLHHAALFNERCAAYLEAEILESCQSLEDIDFRKSETVRLYTAWGAMQKVKLMS